MKTFTTSVILLLSALAYASPAVMVSNANVDPAECAELGGVLQIAASDLPEGVSLADVRKCADHPAGNSRNKETWSLPPLDDSNANVTSARDVEDISSVQACYYDAQYGCTFEGGTGYCWKHCGASNDDGQWCWTASGFGGGAWNTCNTWADCGVATFSCGRGCARCACGC